MTNDQFSKREAPSLLPWFGYLAIGYLVIALTGCTYARGKADKVEAKAADNAGQLTEESRALTTAAKEALEFAPTNPPVNLAKRFLARDQQIEGLPVERIDVAALLATNVQALALLEKRFAAQDDLLRERAELALKLEAANQRLQEMGRLYEAEKNQSVVRRVGRWLKGIFGVGGLIALVIFCPAVLPVLGGLVSFVVGKIPALVNLFGVVGKSAFDRVVVGVGEVRAKLKVEAGNNPAKTYTVGEVRDLIDRELKEALETGPNNFRPLVMSRRERLNV
jgi:uncharacterized protein YlaI